VTRFLHFLVGTARVSTAIQILAVTGVLYAITKWDVLFAAVFFYITMVFGLKMLGGFSAPMAEPPPPGELRKVRLEYRCDICGSEARMTFAPDEDPPAPRHCLDDMRLITPVE
jgi:hypothetical protein